MNLPRFALNKPWIVAAFAGAAVLWGYGAFSSLPRREDPEFTVRTCLVTTAWPGASAQTVEKLVTDPIEKAVDDLSEVKRVRSKSQIGVSVVFVDLEDAVADVDQAWDKVRDKVESVRPTLPEGALPPQVQSDLGDTAAMQLALYQVPLAGETDVRRTYTPREMQLVAQRVRDELKLIPAVAKVELIGVQDEVIYVEADAGVWSRLALTGAELKEYLAARNIVAPGGSIDTDAGQFAVKPTGEFRAVREVRRAVAGTHSSGAPVYLSEMNLSVRRAYRDPPRTISRFCDYAGGMRGAAPAIIVSFTMKDGNSIADLGSTVSAKLQEWKDSILPRDVAVGIVTDQPMTVDKKVSDFVDNLLQAVVIVVLVAYLLVGLRTAIVMAAAIPVVVLTTVGVLPLFSVQIEQTAISSLIIALGLLVDNAIEVSDNHHRLLGEGLDPRRAAIDGAQQVSFPMLIATLTTVFAFLPMLTLPGGNGEYIRSLPIVVSATLLISWLLAMTVTPLMSFLVTRGAKRHGADASGAPLAIAARWLKRIAGRSEATTGSSRIYAPACRFALRHKFFSLGLGVLMFAGACALIVTGLIETQQFPPSDRPQFTIDIWLPQGSTIARTDEVCAQVEDILEECSPSTEGSARVERLDSYASYVGEGGPTFILTMNREQPARNYAQIVVNVTRPEFVTPYLADVDRAAASRVAGARVVPTKLVFGPPVYPIELRVAGRDLEAVRRYGKQIEVALRRTAGTVDVHSSWGNLGYELTVLTDEERARLAGVSNASVAHSLTGMLSGQYLTTYREGDHRVPVYLRLPPSQRDSLDAARSVHVEGMHGKVPLDAVADVAPAWRPGTIEHYRKVRTLTVKSRTEDGQLANTVLARAMPRIREITAAMPPGYGLEIGGEQEETAKSQADMGRAMGISLILIVLCLVVQYNSLAKPGMILVTIPLAWTGAYLALFLTGRPLGFMATLGLLSLTGVVLNDAIVLVEFVEMRIRDTLASGEGRAAPGEKSVCGLARDVFRAAVAEGSGMRIKPIMLTTLTTVGGLVPLVMFGGPLWAPMAIVIMGGMLYATLMTLFVLPAVFCIFVENFGVRVGTDHRAAATEGGIK